MKFLFVVQGEGRGHFMQAIEMKAILERNGHEVVACLVGKNPARVVPQYFYDRMQGTMIDSFESPNFVQGVGGKRPSYFNTFVEILGNDTSRIFTYKASHNLVSVAFEHSLHLNGLHKVASAFTLHYK